MKLLNFRQRAITISPLRYHGCVMHNGSLWSLGGEGADSAPVASRYYVNVHKADPVAGTQQIMPMLPHPVAHAETLLVGGKAVVIGGMSAAGSVFVESRQVMVVDLLNPLPTAHQLLPFGCHDTAGVAVSSTQALMWGGWVGATSTVQAGLIDVSGTPTFQVFNLITSRVYSTGHCYQGHGYAIGGFTWNGTGNVLASVERLDPVAKTATLHATLNSPRKWHASRLVGDRIFVFGGEDRNMLGKGPAIGSIEEINLSTGGVTRVGYLKDARYHCNTFSVNIGGHEYVCLFGGQKDNGVPCRSIEMFDTVTGQTEIVANLPTVTVDHDRLVGCAGNVAYVLCGDSLSGVGTQVLFEMTFPAGAVCYRM